MKRFILLSLVFSILFFSREAFAYHIGTHAYLTDEAVNLYNNSYPQNPFPENIRSYLIDGARREDDNVRPMNHFFDPMHDIGFHDPLLGTWEKSKDWANDQANQNSIKYKVPATIASILSITQSGKMSGISSETDFTWHKAIEYYVGGEKEKAFFALGHVLHLIEDASVPDHTRNDPHPGDSPYENWTGKFKLDNKDLGLSARLAGKNPMQFNNLSLYFDGLAKYSNNNFYSKDTIGVGSGYWSPEPDYFDKDKDGLTFGFKIDNELGNFHLLQSKGIFSWSSSNNNPIDFPIVMSDYWSHLSTKAVQYGAGVVDLFFKEAEAAKNDPNFKKKEEKSFLASIGEAIRDIFVVDEKAGAIIGYSTQPDNFDFEEGEDILPPEDEEFETVEVNEENDELNDLHERIDSLINKTADLKKKALANKATSEAVSSKTPPVVATGTPQLPFVQSPIIQQPAQPQAYYAPPVTNYYYYYNQTTTSTGNTTTSTATSAVSDSNTNSTSTAQNVAGNSIYSNVIFISEMLFRAMGTGGDAGKEFVEIYNAGDIPIDLAGWSLKHSRSNSTSTGSLALFGEENHSDKTVIPAKSFLLVGLNNYVAANYDGTLPDILRSASLPNVSGQSGGVTVTVYLSDIDGAMVGGVAYTNTSILKAGESVERKAKTTQGLCVSAGSGEGEFIGNTCTGSVMDFESRAKPKPQNSASLPEPRTAPVLSGATVSYSTSDVKLVFAWNEALDSTGDALSVGYEIRDASSSQIFATTTGAIGLSRKVDEIGRSYGFSVRALDRDGMGSAPINLSVNVPSFFSNFYFYRDSRSGGVENIADAYYDNYPFVAGSQNSWKVALFYINSDAKKDLELNGSNQFLPTDSSNLATVKYPRCSGNITLGRYLLLPDSNEQWSMTGGGLNPDSMVFPEDRHFIFPISAQSGVMDFGPSAYITAAFYEYSSVIGGYPIFRLVAADKHRYHFQNSPPVSSAPTVPSDLVFQFSDLNSSVSLSWPKSTDEDSIDESISYEVNYSSSTVFSESNWFSVDKVVSTVLSVIYPHNYRFAVRAVDDFGNVSPPVIRDWGFPAGFFPWPGQGDASQIIGASDGSGQRFFVPFGGMITRLSMTMNGWGGGTETSVAVYQDNGGTMGDIIAKSASVTHQWPSGGSVPVVFEFAFPNPVSLSGGAHYWLVPENGTSNQNKIYGSAGDSYPDGHWSGDAGKDAYFHMR